MIIYNVNEEKGTVVAWFEGASSGREYWEESLNAMVDKILSVSTFGFPYGLVEKVVDNMKDLTGKAKCHPSDTFNSEVGMKIAKDRLNDKFNRVKERVLLDLQDWVDYQADEVTERIERKLECW